MTAAEACKQVADFPWDKSVRTGGISVIAMFLYLGVQYQNIQSEQLDDITNNYNSIIVELNDIESELKHIRESIPVINERVKAIEKDVLIFNQKTILPDAVEGFKEVNAIIKATDRRITAIENDVRWLKEISYSLNRIKENRRD